MYQYDHLIRVRYGETDQMGVVYYGNYAQYLEIGRVETIRSLGISYKRLEEEGIMLPVLHLDSRFLRPATYDDELIIRTKIKEMPDKLIIFHTDILNSNEEVVNRSVVKLFFVDMESNKRISAPSSIKEKLAPFFD